MLEGPTTRALSLFRKDKNTTLVNICYERVLEVSTLSISLEGETPKVGKAKGKGKANKSDSDYVGVDTYLD